MQPVKDVLAAIKFLEKHDITRYNILSLSTAKLGTVVAQSLGGKKVTVTPDDFLPFDSRKQKDRSGVTEESLRILKRIMKTRKVDPRLVSTLANEIKMASMREDE